MKSGKLLYYIIITCRFFTFCYKHRVEEMDTQKKNRTDEITQHKEGKTYKALKMDVK